MLYVTAGGEINVSSRKLIKSSCGTQKHNSEYRNVTAFQTNSIRQAVCFSTKIIDTSGT